MELIYEILKKQNSEDDIYNLMEVALLTYPVSKYSIELFVSDTVLHLKVYSREVIR